jgi:hypothetical protein
MHDIYFVAPICQKLYSSCPHILISKSLEDLKEVNFNHFIVFTGWLLQGGRGKATPGFLVAYWYLPAGTGYKYKCLPLHKRVTAATITRWDKKSGRSQSPPYYFYFLILHAENPKPCYRSPTAGVVFYHRCRSRRSPGGVAVCSGSCLIRDLLGALGSDLLLLLICD